MSWFIFKTNRYILVLLYLIIFQLKHKSLHISYQHPTILSFFTLYLYVVVYIEGDIQINMFFIIYAIDFTWYNLKKKIKIESKIDPSIVYTKILGHCFVQFSFYFLKTNQIVLNQLNIVYSQLQLIKGKGKMNMK